MQHKWSVETVDAWTSMLFQKSHLHFDHGDDGDDDADDDDDDDDDDDGDDDDDDAGNDNDTLSVMTMWYCRGWEMA